MAAVPWLVGRGPTLGVASRANAAVLGSKPALHDRSGTLSWRELDRRSDRLARAFRDLGLHPGDRVATLLRNGREQVETLLAGQKGGLVWCPLNTWGTGSELRALLDQVRPRLVVYDTLH